PDLAVANDVSPNGTVSVLLGNGDGSFQDARPFAASGTTSVAVADVNGDGLLDLATSLSVLLGNGDGSCQKARNFAAGRLPRTVAVGEFNGDGRPDLAVANAAECCPWRDGSVSILVGNGDGSFQAPRNIALGNNPTFVAVGEVNGDGSLDVVVAYSD